MKRSRDFINSTSDSRVVIRVFRPHRLIARGLGSCRERSQRAWHRTRCRACAALAGQAKAFDVVALGNLCVDVVISLEELPPSEEIKRPEMLRKLVSQTEGGGTEFWEAGAQSNFLIAASRLGLRAASAANVGEDVYGQFLSSILQNEGVARIEPLAPDSFEEQLKQTLLCFVLLDRFGQHQFCSRYDFGPWPLLPGVGSLPAEVLKLLASTEAVFVNGFIFDELPGSVVLSAVEMARRAGAATFFDPGPRAWTLQQGDRKAALDAILDASHVVLMTQEEAEAVTGLAAAEAAAAAVLDRPGAITEWCVIKMGARGALIRSRDQSLYLPAFQVEAVDTVGCGDSFAAAVVLGYIRREALGPILALANAVGAATATSRGAGRNVAQAARVRELLEQQQQRAWPDGAGGPAIDLDGNNTKLERSMAAGSAITKDKTMRRGNHVTDAPLTESYFDKALHLLEHGLRMHL